MSDTSPTNQAALRYGASPRAACTAQPGELLFEFHVERTHTLYRCELRDRGTYGVEAQFFDPIDLRIAHLFPTRALAITWAERERQALLADGEDR
jgi:hypothetical protein